MVEEIYSLIYVLFIILLLVTDVLEPAGEDQGKSELHSYDRYAVADQVMYRQSLACGY